MGRHVKNRQLEPGSTTVEIPQVATADRPAGQNGQIIFNTTTNTYQGYIGSAWHNISSANGEKTITLIYIYGI